MQATATNDFLNEVFNNVKVKSSILDASSVNDIFSFAILNVYHHA